MELDSHEPDAKDYLISLNNCDINCYLNDLCKSHDTEDKECIIMDILLLLKLSPKDTLYIWIEESLKKMYKVKLN